MSTNSNSKSNDPRNNPAGLLPSFTQNSAASAASTTDKTSNSAALIDRETEPPGPMVVAEMSIAEAIHAFLRDLGSGHSPATVRTYRVALSRFVAYLSSQVGVDPAQTPAGALKADWAVGCVRWISQGQPQTNNPTPPSKAANGLESTNATSRTPKTTIATYIAGLSRFYKWCALERFLVLPSDEYERMTLRFKDLRGKVQRTILDKVPADEVLDRLLSTAYDHPLPSITAGTTTSTNPSPRSEKADVKESARLGGFRGNLSKLAEQDKRRHELIRLRNISLLETLKTTGARVSEVTGLTRGALDNTNRRARVVGKGSKERWIYFSQVAWNALQEYFTLRSRMMNLAAQDSNNNGSSSEETGDITDIRPARSRRSSSARARAGQLASHPVFASHHRGAGWKQIKPMTPDAVRKMLWGLVEETGLETHITPHKFRHWFATRMLSATGDLAATQDLLGHANPATTRIYAQVSEVSKQQLHRKVFD